MRIVLYTGYQTTHWNPTFIKSTGLGGTEQCVLNLAKSLAKINEVYVVGDVLEGTFDEVIYLKTHNALKKIGNNFVDFVIGVSYINYLYELDSLNFANSALWLHNTDFYPWHRGETLPNEGRDLLNDSRLSGVVCLTEWHKENFVQKYPEVKNKLFVIGNGIDLDKFHRHNNKRKNSFIYTSHAERGLQKVLDEWNHITKKLPNAELSISTPEYGLEYFNKHFLSQIESIESIKFHGSLPLEKLYEKMSECEYWYYPTDYEETFCITALEMLGHGVKPIVNEIAGLKETLADFNLHSLNNIDQTFNKQNLDNYIQSCDWNRKKIKWEKYIYNMSAFNIDCVYIISLSFDDTELERWKSEIRKNLIPSYEGPIIGKPAVNGAAITESWLNENNYTLYNNWKLEDSSNDYWNRPLDPGAIGCAISHHKIWSHAHKNNFNNILILEEDFQVVEQLTNEYTDNLPNDFDLFYLGRNLVEGLGTIRTHDEPVGDGKIVKPTASYNTHAYILSKKGIKSLLDQGFHNYILPVDEFLATCYAGHSREDLNFIATDLEAYAPNADLQIVKQSRPASSLGPRTDLSNRKHPDLYSYWDDPEEWKSKFVAYSARTKEWELIIDEPFDNCFSMPLFTQEFCEKIREEAEHSNAWTTDRHEFYPTTDMLLEVIAMDRIYYQILHEYVMPASYHAFSLNGNGWTDMQSEDFLAKYVPTAQGHLSLHHDASNITALVTLSNFDEYQGGGTYFSHQKKLIKEKQGYVSIHPGNITHKHGARATTKGTRYIIVSFMKNSQIMK